MRLLTERNFVLCTLVAVAMLAAAPARAQEETPEQEVLDFFMTSIGLTRGGPTIDYRERSPLVIPPNDSLPPPESAKVADPNWPVDPEIKQARALAAAAHKDDGRTSSQRMDDAARPLPLSELNKGRTSRRQNNPTGDESGMFPSSWSDLGYKGGIFGNMFSSKEEESAKFTGEPRRTTLTAPPVGYQTPSPNQPYALGKERYKDKPIDYYGERKYER
jgi:hypothetical protein